MKTVERHVAIILAAGGSVRMGGSPKQLLMRRGETLVHRTARLVRDTQPARTIVVVGAHSETVSLALDGMRLDIAVNPRWPQGLATSLARGSQALGHHYGPVLLVGCDQPALHLGHLRRLVELAAANPRGYAAVSHEGTRVGLPAVVPGGVLRYLSRLRGEHGVAARLSALPVGDVARLEAPELQFDVDDACDLRAAINRGWIDDDEIEFGAGIALQFMPTLQERYGV
ncbi:nucleotidyltransferase family protein [Agrilutibacter solisilvae]|uniref:Nucleotidyltransferase family protein n=1 Tax=Agrilutibacter solisilvae TaxID=2763317 RepID=A0A974Y0N5_9GAMM|nr:nucleotidyltransferase family protein [Lysobacter solisilvae]QSX79256.1 nucleotidyltransferase family protein [Lysobacter solisilvae]